MSSKLQMQYKIVNRCRIYKQQLPNITPVISNLSTYYSVSGAYTIVYITGNNFSLSGPTGYSSVTFGNYNVPVTFLSPYNIAFVIPSVLNSGTYSVSVVNNNFPLYIVVGKIPAPII